MEVLLKVHLVKTFE